MARNEPNIFTISGDTVSIFRPGWESVAYASIKDDYVEELLSLNWVINNGYLYSSKKKMYLHIYIMRKWYGDEKYEKMLEEGFVVDHMDNNSFNCRIDNLSFLSSYENKAKGMNVDRLSATKTHIALTFYKDFHTELIQIAIAFNFPAIAKIKNLSSPAVIDLAYLLYDREYELVLNDARTILYDYIRDGTFEPEMMHDIDYHIEGAYGVPVNREAYDRYIEGGHGHTVCYFTKVAPLENWKKDDRRQFFHLRGKPVEEA